MVSQFLQIFLKVGSMSLYILLFPPLTLILPSSTTQAYLCILSGDVYIKIYYSIATQSEVQGSAVLASLRTFSR